MTILNKTLMAALVGGAIGFAIPAGAQSSVTVVDSDEPAVTVITKTPADATGPVTVTRADGSTVVTERVVRRRVVVPTACNFNDYHNPTGGVGGAIGGRMILGTTTADDVPIPGNCAPIHR
jgi:hypothetical protein